jgi:hypothetical protein
VRIASTIITAPTYSTGRRQQFIERIETSAISLLWQTLWLRLEYQRL